MAVTESIKTALPHLWPIEDAVDQTARTMALYERGLLRGDSTGFANLDKHYSVETKQWTLITGFPGCGKSEFLDAMLVNLAERGEWEFAFYSPENYPTETHIAKLAEKHLRKPFGRGPTERMTRAELDDALEWIQQRFIWLAPEYRDYKTLLAAAKPFQRKQKRGLVLDPWNTLEHKRPKDMTETEYIAAALTDITNWAREHDMHIFIVAHPMKMYRDKETGKRPVPTPYDIAGSANWYNKADNILCVDRDQLTGSQDVQVYVQKVRFKHIGNLGIANLSYDRVTGRYHDALGSHTEQLMKDF